MGKDEARGGEMTDAREIAGRSGKTYAQLCDFLKCSSEELDEIMAYADIYDLVINLPDSVDAGDFREPKP